MELETIQTNEKTKEVVKMLNQVLSDEFMLYMKTLNYHWNVTGPHFNDLHKFFESQYKELAGFLDDSAERARAVGGRAVGTLTEVFEYGRLSEDPKHRPSAPEMIKQLLSDHQAIIGHLRSDSQKCVDQYEDVGTSSFLSGLLEKHEKMAWMLRAFSDSYTG